MGDAISTWGSALVNLVTFRSARRARVWHVHRARPGHTHDQPNKYGTGTPYLLGSVR